MEEKGVLGKDTNQGDSTASGKTYFIENREKRTNPSETGCVFEQIFIACRLENLRKETKKETSLPIFSKQVEYVECCFLT